MSPWNHVKQSDVSQASHPKLRYLCRVGLGCTGEGAPQAAAGLAPKALVETHQQRDWGGVLELRWPQVFWALRSPLTPADPARSWGMYPADAGGEAHLTMELSPTKQRCFWDLLPIWTLLMGNIPGVKQ